MGEGGGDTRGRKSIILLKDFQALSARPSDKGEMRLNALG
jgi:hypothetical protein